MKLTKSTAEVYLFNEMPRFVWAKFTVEDLGGRGRISIASDYGNWQYGWPACGNSFKAFLCSLNIGYVAGKFGAAQWFDHERSVKQVKQDLLSARRDWLSKEDAREMWKTVEDLEDAGNETAFGTTIYNSDKLFQLYDGAEMPILTSIDPCFRRFWEECWSLLVTEFKREQAV